ncbi:hypothetical protein SNE40_010668 [Patella caerulea]|uniref:Uncharacterized protein n=1 Tax=Patella caerulea TaxID=87958 RepID=A0AAN8PUZ3_PATCE
MAITVPTVNLCVLKIASTKNVRKLEEVVRKVVWIVTMVNSASPNATKIVRIKSVIGKPGDVPDVKLVSIVIPVTSRVPTVKVHVDNQMEFVSLVANKDIGE